MNILSNSVEGYDSICNRVTDDGQDRGNEVNIDLNMENTKDGYDEKGIMQ